MKADVLSLNGSKIGEINLPNCFNERVREDIIKKGFEAEVSKKRSPYGAFKLAGKQASASGKIRHARRKWKTAYGRGISRVPRKIFSRRGTQFHWEGAFAPGTKGGRAAHPPKAEKIWKRKINKKERIKAVKSAIAATADMKMLSKRYKNIIVEKINLPLVVESKINDIKKTREFKAVIINILKKLSLQLINIALREKKKIRAGKGKGRGRVYKKAKGVLIITSKDVNVAKSLEGIGVDVININKLNLSKLAPAGVPGRLVIYTEDAIKEMEKIKRLQ